MQLLAGFFVGWLVANTIASMRPKSWLELVDELGAKLIEDVTIKLDHLGKPSDWGG